ncbi:MAG: hypothetical protein KME11_15560 [Timaviella obliquedivisa GSE-PSE-MK23-08B]|nr:hypothetical protein [Timaviella obliquedivisa GSE-PSE-MK23-08B]
MTRIAFTQQCPRSHCVGSQSYCKKDNGIVLARDRIVSVHNRIAWKDNAIVSAHNGIVELTIALC